LALIVSIHYWVDGGKPFYRGANRALRGGIVDGRDRLLLTSAGDHRAQGQDFRLRRAIGRDWKAKPSLGLYIVTIITTLGSSWIAQAVLLIAALIWMIPDRRIEKHLAISHDLAIGPQ
jgi:hypothetical protein